MADIADRLFNILSSPGFLSMQGLANEVPIFIHAYDAAQEDETRRMVDHLASRLRTSGVELAQVDLFDLILEQLEDEQRLEKIIEREATLGKLKLKGLLSNLSDPKSRLIPRLMSRIGGVDIQLTLLTGVGRVYPFLRTHTILEAIQPAMTAHPIVMFFPGEYVQESMGSQLHLFGSVPNPKLSRAYYRAFNLADYRL